MDLKEESLLGGDTSQHWYYRSKLAALRLALSGLPPMPVLDVGAGSGFFSRALLAGGEASEATCVDPGYVSDSDQEVNGRTLRFRRVAEPGEAGLLLMMDVLEHVPDDGALLAAYVAQVPRGAHVMVTVPAFQTLWSGHDVFLEHHRRYTLHQVERLLRNAGLQVELGCYFFAAVLPLVAAVRLGKRLLHGDRPSSDMRRFGPATNAALGAICRAELAVFRANRLAGASVFARAVKP
jgi:hypothetical protein